MDQEVTKEQVTSLDQSSDADHRADNCITILDEDETRLAAIHGTETTSFMLGSQSMSFAKEDLARLENGNFLNDTIMNFYFQWYVQICCRDTHCRS